jgi:hypothetical protein
MFQLDMKQLHDVLIYQDIVIHSESNLQSTQILTYFWHKLETCVSHFSINQLIESLIILSVSSNLE